VKSISLPVLILIAENP